MEPGRNPGGYPEGDETAVLRRGGDGQLHAVPRGGDVTQVISSGDAPTQVGAFPAVPGDDHPTVVQRALTETRIGAMGAVPAGPDPMGRDGGSGWPGELGEPREPYVSHLTVLDEAEGPAARALMQRDAQNAQARVTNSEHFGLATSVFTLLVLIALCVQAMDVTGGFAKLMAVLGILLAVVSLMLVVLPLAVKLNKGLPPVEPEGYDRSVLERLHQQMKPPKTQTVLELRDQTTRQLRRTQRFESRLKQAVLCSTAAVVCMVVVAFTGIF